MRNRIWIRLRPRRSEAMFVLNSVLFPLLAFWLGLQMVRRLFALIFGVVNERWRQPVAVVLGTLLGIMLVAGGGGTGWVMMMDSGRAMVELMVICVGGMGLILGGSFWGWWGDGRYDLVATSVGVWLFSWFVSVYGGEMGQSVVNVGLFGLGALGGIFLDTVVHGIVRGYDLGWQRRGALKVGIGTFLVGLSLVSTVYWFFNPTLLFVQREAVVWGSLAWGPFLYLYLLWWGNPAELTSQTGWSFPWAWGMLLLGQGLALVMGVVVLLRPWWGGVVWLAGAVLFLGVLGLQVAGWRKWGAIGRSVGGSCAGLLLLANSLWGTAAEGVGLAGWYLFSWLLLGAGVALTYVQYNQHERPWPIPGGVWSVVAGVLLLAGSRGASVGLAEIDFHFWVDGSLVIVVVFLLLLVVIGWWWEQLPEPIWVEAVAANRLRVMSYNVHNGLSPLGHMDWEELAETIMIAGAEVVVFQEIHKGWIVMGGGDMLYWLGERLGMEAAFGPTTGPAWGNAVLSRLPMKLVRQWALPPDDLPIDRGVMEVVVTKGETVWHLLGTHYYDPEWATAIRQEQTAALLAKYDGSRPALLLGDMNAKPESVEMEMLREAGWQEALAVVGAAERKTYSTVEGVYQIDYVWVTADVRVLAGWVTGGLATDHLAVVAEVGWP
ncbi:MAG TPA: endonuclease/exonuclease/phosphatase family protein [Anaerolineae bacterium]|nr:endonuclease/exonuclease/phosphatase family protein [Anaerolineae bacterium]